MRPRPPSASRPSRYHPHLDALEDRCLLAASVTVLSGNTLFIRGTNHADHVQIVDNGTSGINNVEVVVNRRVFAPGVAITNVDVRTRAGNDSVVYTLTGPLLRGVSRNVSVHLGTGNDSFRARIDGNLQTASSLGLNVHASTGFNQLSMIEQADIATGASLVASFQGGDVANAISATYAGQLKGTLVVFARGGVGPDQINGFFALANGSSGSLSTQELGGFGDDRLSLDVVQINAFDHPSIAASIDGGPGINHCAMSSNVTATHCQFRTML
jgi:hypothetical protein